MSNGDHSFLQHLNVSMFATSEMGLLASISGFSLKVWDPIAPKCLHTFQVHKGAFSCAAFLNGDKTLVTAHLDGTIQFWDLTSAHTTPFKIFQKNSETIFSLMIMKDGSIVTGSGDSIVRLWDPIQEPSKALKKELTGHQGNVNSLAERSDNILISAGGKTIILWNADTGESWQSSEEHDSTIYRVAVLENDLIVTAGWNGTLKMWK